MLNSLSNKTYTKSIIRWSNTCSWLEFPREYFFLVMLANWPHYELEIQNLRKGSWAVWESKTNTVQDGIDLRKLLTQETGLPLWTGTDSWTSSDTLDKAKLMPETGKPGIHSCKYLFSAQYASFCREDWQQKCLQFLSGEQAGNAASGNSV